MGILYGITSHGKGTAAADAVSRALEGREREPLHAVRDVRRGPQPDSHGLGPAEQPGAGGRAAAAAVPDGAGGAEALRSAARGGAPGDHAAGLSGGERRAASRPGSAQALFRPGMCRVRGRACHSGSGLAVGAPKHRTMNCAALCSATHALTLFATRTSRVPVDVPTPSQTKTNPPCTQAQDEVVAALCAELNRYATLYPGPSLRPVYEILPASAPK